MLSILFLFLFASVQKCLVKNSVNQLLIKNEWSNTLVSPNYSDHSDISWFKITKCKFQLKKHKMPSQFLLKWFPIFLF